MRQVNRTGNPLTGIAWMQIHWQPFDRDSVDVDSCSIETLEAYPRSAFFHGQQSSDIQPHGFLSLSGGFSFHAHWQLPFL